jgi:hypothetical protein
MFLKDGKGDPLPLAAGILFFRLEARRCVFLPSFSEAAFVMLRRGCFFLLLVPRRIC